MKVRDAQRAVHDLILEVWNKSVRPWLDPAVAEHTILQIDRRADFNGDEARIIVNGVQRGAPVQIDSFRMFPASQSGRGMAEEIFDGLWARADAAGILVGPKPELEDPFCGAYDHVRGA